MTEESKLPGAPVGEKRSIRRSIRGADGLARSLLEFFLDLPRKFQLGLIALTIGGCARVSGLDVAVLDYLFTYDPKPERRAAVGRCSNPDVLLERADLKELER